MKLTRRGFVRVSSAAALGTLAAPGLLLAQSGRPITVVSPYQAGGPVDGVIRLITEHIARELGRPVLLDNKPGANGIVATQSVARARNDGLTLVVSSSGTLSLNVLLRPNAPFAISDFVSVGKMFEGSLTVTVNSQLPVTTVQGLADWSKQTGQALRYGSLGPGSVTDLYGIMLGKRLGVETRSVAYRNNAAISLDLLANQIELHFATPIALTEYANAGQMRILAVTSSERQADFPEIPSIAEAGFPDLTASFWQGLSAPAGSPPELMAALNTALNNALTSDAVREFMANQGLHGTPGTPADLDAQIADDLARWGAIVKAEGIVLE